MISRLFVLSALALVSIVGCSAAPGDSQTNGSEEALAKRGCHSNTQCRPLEFCDTEAAKSCGGAGLCTSRGITLFCMHTTTQVCGCDGNAYGSACLAHKAGVSVAQDAFKAANIDGDTLAEMPWADASQTYFYAFTGNGTLQNDSGRFTAYVEPPCQRTQPHCQIAIHEKTGSFRTTGSTLELDYDDGTVSRFHAQLDCTKAWRLVGDDWGHPMTLKVTTITP